MSLDGGILCILTYKIHFSRVVIFRLVVGGGGPSHLPCLSDTKRKWCIEIDKIGKKSDDLLLWEYFYLIAKSEFHSRIRQYFI